ncbi:hypothetical protein [Spirillospora sp. CA-294931]
MNTQLRTALAAIVGEALIRTVIAVVALALGVASVALASALGVG